MKIKAGFIQFEPILGYQEKNIDKISEFIDTGKKCGLDCYYPNWPIQAITLNLKSKHLILPKKLKKVVYLDFLFTQAKDLNTYIVSGFHEKEGDLIFTIHLFW